MKIFTNAVLLLTLSSTLLIAEPSIDTQIQEIRNAAPSERVELMNELKMRLSTMNSNDRSSAITQLRSHMSSNANMENDTHSQGSFNSHMEGVQADNMRQIDGMERMHQKQAGDQYQHMQNDTGVNSTGTNDVNHDTTYNQMFNH